MDGELPSHFADRVGYAYSSNLNKDRKKEYGQYFTPIKIADYMSSLCTKLNETVLNILDPGCGTGTLSCSLVEFLAQKSTILNEINLTSYELDANLLPYTNKVFEYLAVWIKKEYPYIIFHYKIINNDFILDNQSTFDEATFFTPNETSKRFDIIISNPPYFKISKSDERATIASSIVH